MYDNFTYITSEFVNSARVVVPVFIDRLRFCILLYCVCVFWMQCLCWYVWRGWW